MLEVGDIIMDIEGTQSIKPLYGIITAIRKGDKDFGYGDEKSYFIDWFDNDRYIRYADYMYESEIEKVE
jgi:hypothetical protein